LCQAWLEAAVYGMPMMFLYRAYRLVVEIAENRLAAHVFPPVRQSLFQHAQRFVS